jgi:hypothetical protein
VTQGIERVRERHALQPRGKCPQARGTRHETITPALIAGALRAGALALAGMAHADAAFLATLRVVPVTANTGNEADLPTARHAACTNYAHGFTNKDMVCNFARLTGKCGECVDVDQPGAGVLVPAV